MYRSFRLYSLFQRWLCFSLLLAGCRPHPITPTPIAFPTQPATVAIGVTHSAIEISQLITSTVPTEWIIGNDAVLLTDVQNGALSAALLYHIPDAAAPTLWINPVALSGLLFIVHPDNPVQTLTIPQLQMIFSGRITDWKAVGGADMPIMVMGRESGSGERTLWQQRVMGEQRLTINAMTYSTPDELIGAIAKTSGGIGFIMLGPSLVERKVRALAINGLLATPEALIDQSYPLMSPLYWVSQAEPMGDVRSILASLQSEAGQAALGGRWGRLR